MENRKTNYTVECTGATGAQSYAVSEMMGFRIETNSFDSIEEWIIDLLNMRKYNSGVFIFMYTDNESGAKGLLTVIMDNHEVVTYYSQPYRR